MAWWFTLIFAAYALLWTLTRDWVALTPTTLALFGLSAGAYVGFKVPEPQATADGTE